MKIFQWILCAEFFKTKHFEVSGLKLPRKRYFGKKNLEHKCRTQSQDLLIAQYAEFHLKHNASKFCGQTWSRKDVLRPTFRKAKSFATLFWVIVAHGENILGHMGS